MAKLTTRTAALVGDIVDSAIMWIDDATSTTSLKATWLVIRTKLANYFATVAQGALADSALQNVVEDTTPQLGAALDGQGFDLNNLGVAFLTEQAAAEADVAGKGQLWVLTATPNVPMFTDDAGTDFNLLSEVFTSDVAVAGNQDYVFWFDAPFAGSILTTRTKTASGTCTVTFKVNTTALGGTANSASSSAQEQTHSTSNTFAKGDKIQATVSSNSAALNLAMAFYGVRGT